MPHVKILGPDGRPIGPGRGTAPPLRARYDAASDSADTRNHWVNADGLSARAANDPETRRKLRNRARYERDSNSYLSGMAESLAGYVIGTGPRLQFRTPDRDVNARASAAFEEWTAAIGLAEKLRTYREDRCINGEGFLFLATNPELPTPVQLDLRDIEADQVATPDLWAAGGDAVDGIVFDRHGNPREYHVLKQHPGDQLSMGEWGEYDRVPAWQVLHWFKRRRAGQARGVPEVTPALTLYALLRRYTTATVTAAEVAALFAVLLKSNFPPEDGDDGLVPFDTQEIARGMMATLPDGYEAQQMKPEHPATTYEMFERAVIRQIARCLRIPYAIAAGDYSQVNYSSGRLGNQDFHQSVYVDRYHLETAILDRILRAWLAEARLASPDLIDGLDLGPDPRRVIRLPRHAWRWDGFKHVDPQKEANAQAQRLTNGTTTLDIECAEDGNDWREIADQQAEERAYFADRGLPYPGDSAPTPSQGDPESIAEAMANHPRSPLNGFAHA